MEELMTTPETRIGPRKNCRASWQGLTHEANPTMRNLSQLAPIDTSNSDLDGLWAHHCRCNRFSTDLTAEKGLSFQGGNPAQ